MRQRLLALALATFLIIAVVSISACASTTSPPVPGPTVTTQLTSQPEGSPTASATKPASQPTASQAAPTSAANSIPTSNVATPTKVSFGLIAAVMAAPNYVALEKGYLREQGIDLSIESFPDTVRIMTLIATGKLHMGQVTMGVAALNAFARKTDMVIVASANQESGSFLVVRKDLYDSGAVKSVADLKGRKVALNGKGTMLEYSLATMLEKGNVKMTDVDIPILAWPDMLVALRNKAIDAGLIGEPIATQAVKLDVGVKLPDASVPRGQNGTIFANSTWAKENPQAVRNYLIGYIRAIRDLNGGKIHDDPVALDIISKYTRVPVETLKEIPGPYWDPNGRLDRKSIRDVQQFFMETKAVQYSEPIPIDSIIDESYLEQALAVVGTVPK